MHARDAPDPVTFDVIRSALVEATEEELGLGHGLRLVGGRDGREQRDPAFVTTRGASVTLQLVAGLGNLVAHLVAEVLDLAAQGGRHAVDVPDPRHGRGRSSPCRSQSACSPVHAARACLGIHDKDGVGYGLEDRF